MVEFKLFVKIIISVPSQIVTDISQLQHEVGESGDLLGDYNYRINIIGFLL